MVWGSDCLAWLVICAPEDDSGMGESKEQIPRGVFSSSESLLTPRLCTEVSQHPRAQIVSGLTPFVTLCHPSCPPPPPAISHHLSALPTELCLQSPALHFDETGHSQQCKLAVILTSGFALSAPPSWLVHTPASASPSFPLVVLSLRPKPR